MPYIGREVDVTPRSFNPQRSSMARPFCLAIPLRPVVGELRSTKLAWTYRHSGMLDSGKEGDAP
jgi:hypothetical protein